MVATGTVNYLKIGDDFGMVKIDEESGGSETLILWYDEDTGGGPTALYTSMLMVAAARGLTVEVTHEDDSSYIQMVKILGA